jgi:hypothetical protein
MTNQKKQSTDAAVRLIRRRTRREFAPEEKVLTVQTLRTVPRSTRLLHPVHRLVSVVPPTHLGCPGTDLQLAIPRRQVDSGDDAGPRRCRGRSSVSRLRGSRTARPGHRKGGLVVVCASRP